MMSRRSPAVLLLLLVAAIPAFALSIGKFNIRDFAVAGGRVAFVANGLVVLDATSGAVIVRERSIPSATLIGTPQGILVATPQVWNGSQSRFRLFSTRGDPAWEVRCDLWHAGQDDLICVESPSKQNLRVHVRSLTDGQVRWSFDTGGSGGEALDAKGRLMLVNQDTADEETRNTTLTILDLANGRVLATMDLPMLKPSNRGTQPDFEFDGDRVLMRLRDVPGCPETSVQSYEFDLARGLSRSSAECESVLYPQPLTNNTLVTSWVGDGTLFERRSPGAEPWQVIQPLYRVEESSWRFEHVHEQGGLLCLESNAWRFGTLDCIDLATGRPLWRYVFPSVTVLHSISVVSPPSHFGRFYESDWRALQGNAPPPLIGLTRPLTLDEQATAPEGTLAAIPRHDTPPTAFDPVAVQPWPEALAFMAFALLPIGAGLGLLIPSWRVRLAPLGSLRRVFVGLGLFFYLLVAGPSLRGMPGLFAIVASLVAPMLAVGAYLFVLFAALSVETRRFTWVVRASLTVFLLLVGVVSLQLF